MRKEVVERIKDVTEELQTTETESLKYKQGYIQAFKDILGLFKEGSL